MDALRTGRGAGRTAQEGNGGAGAGGGLILSPRDRAQYFIQDPNGFGEWFEDYTQGTRLDLGNSPNTGVTLGRNSGHYPAGKRAGTWIGAQGRTYLWNFEAYTAIIGTPRYEAWYMEWGGTIYSVPAADGEIGFVAMANAANAGSPDPQIQIGGDGVLPYQSFGFLGVSSSNYVMKVWDGATANVFDTGVPVQLFQHEQIGVGADGLGGFHFVKGNQIMFSHEDSRGMSIQNQSAGSFVRGGTTEISLRDAYFYIACARSMT